MYHEDAVFNLAYIDYVEKRYDKALKSFQSLQNDAVYAALVPYYIGEIYLVKGNYQQARTVAKAYLEQYPAKKDVPQMERIWGEACFGLNDYQAAIPPLERYREFLCKRLCKQHAALFLYASLPFQPLLLGQ